MADRTAIEWTDATWNPTVGCSIVSPGCINCYAMKMAARIERMSPHIDAYRGLTQPSKAGPVWTGTVRWSKPVDWKPLHWKRPRRIFVNSMSDLFHDDLPDAAIDDVFAVMALSPRHTFQVLTKRPERMRRWFNSSAQPIEGAERRDDVAMAALAIRDQLGTRNGLLAFSDEECLIQADRWPLPNVWLGVSAERQQEADDRIPHLLATPAAVRFVSAEPLLGPLDLYNGDPDPRLGGHQATKTFLGDWWEPHDNPRGPSRHGVDWVIVGGESGPNARPMHPDWVRSLRDQCLVAEVPFFFKQWGEWLAGEANRDPTKGPMHAYRRCDNSSFCWPSNNRAHSFDHPTDPWSGRVAARRVGKKAAGNLLDDRLHQEFPR